MEREPTESERQKIIDLRKLRDRLSSEATLRKFVADRLKRQQTVASQHADDIEYDTPNLPENEIPVQTVQPDLTSVVSNETVMQGVDVLNSHTGSTESNLDECNPDAGGIPAYVPFVTPNMSSLDGSGAGDDDITAYLKGTVLELDKGRKNVKVIREVGVSRTVLLERIHILKQF